MKQELILHQNIASVSLVSRRLCLILRLLEVVHGLIVTLILNEHFLSSLNLLTLDVISVACLTFFGVIL